MQAKNETDIINSVNLDVIPAMIWDLFSDIPDQPRFNFMKLHDDEIMTQIKKYPMDFKNKNFSEMGEQETEELIEQTCVKLFDTITEANFDFFKHGVKAVS